jgi:hypothetical protein
MHLLATVLGSCTQANWQLAKRGAAKNAKDVLDEGSIL